MTVTLVYIYTTCCYDAPGFLMITPGTGRFLQSVCIYIILYISGHFCGLIIEVFFYARHTRRINNRSGYMLVNDILYKEIKYKYYFNQRN